MKIGRIHPCICISHVPTSGDSGTYGMPALKVYQSSGYPERYIPYCPTCGRGGIIDYSSAYLALKHWNELQEQLWEENNGQPKDDAPKPEPEADPRDGYADWHKTHQLLHLPEGEHFQWGHEECRIRSDGKAVLIYDYEYNDWLAPGYRQLQLEVLLEHPERIEPLPFEKWHVESSEPSWIWKRHVDLIWKTPRNATGTERTN